MRSPELQVTADGSHTLYLPDMEEHYHSVNGAIQEAQHVYIRAGLECFLSQSKPAPGDPVSILEMGFGTGLNAFLSALEAQRRGIRIQYTSLEKYPLSDEVSARLNYGSRLPGGEDLFRLIHEAQWEQEVEISPFFSLYKVETDFNAYPYPGMYDVVYYDAFAPDKQADVWNQSLFDALFSSMNTGGILTTYCAKGVVRRMMQQAGFVVERIPGPPGKREMLRASVIS